MGKLPIPILSSAGTHPHNNAPLSALFISFLSPHHQGHFPKMLKSRPHRPFAISTNSQGKRNASPGPPSPTFSEATNVSAVNLGENGPAKIITRLDLKASTQSYENVSPSPPLLIFPSSPFFFPPILLLSLLSPCGPEQPESEKGKTHMPSLPRPFIPCSPP